MKKSISLLTKITPVLILLSLCFILSCQQEGANKEAEEDMKALSNRALKIWSEGNYALLDELYSPEIVRHEVNINEDIVGTKEYKDNVTLVRTAYPDFNVTSDEVFVKDDRVVLRWTVTGTNTGPFGDQPATGKRIQFSGVNINRVIDGKIVEEWVYFNLAAELKQLGYTFNPPSIENKD
jgi:steroid delta-isomerase-like uncharacterized protein